MPVGRGLAAEIFLPPAGSASGRQTWDQQMCAGAAFPAAATILLRRELARKDRFAKVERALSFVLACPAGQSGAQFMRPIAEFHLPARSSKGRGTGRKGVDAA